MSTKQQTKLNLWLASLLKREGKKSSISRGDARELLGYIADDVWAEYEDTSKDLPGPKMLELLALGKSRAARKPGKAARKGK